MHCNIPQAGLRGRHLCVSVTEYPSLNKHLRSPPFKYIYETKRHRTRFLKYVLHLWYSLMTILILVFQHWPSVACRGERERTTWGRVEENKPRHVVTGADNCSAATSRAHFSGRVDVCVHVTVERSHKVAHGIISLFHIWREKYQNNLAPLNRNLHVVIKKRRLLHCMYQALHMALFRRILSLHSSFSPLKFFHFGDTNLPLEIN